MYKVLLVDDEVLIREAIAENIDWHSLGFELAGICENGRQAMEFISETPPDLVLTDICMPFVDGLELAKYIYDNYSEVKVVIISGYDNFEYAKGAIQYQVMEYILKPVTAHELSDALGKVKESLDSERQERHRLDYIRDAYEKSMPLLKERFLNQLIQGKERGSDAEEMLRGYGITLGGELFSVVQIECSSSFEFEQKSEKVTDGLAKFAVFNVSEEMSAQESNCVVFQDAGNVTTLIIAGESEYSLERKIGLLCGRIQPYLAQHLRLHTMAVAGRCVANLQMLHQSYSNLASAREYRFLFEDDSIIYGREFVNRKEGNAVDVIRWANRLNASVKQNQAEEITDEVKAFFRAMKETYVSRDRIVACIQGVILRLIEETDESKVRNTEQRLYELLKGDAKIEEMQRAVWDFCLQIAAVIVAGRESMGQTQAAKALEYIENHYQDSSVTLNSVCKYLTISTSYFSLIFKNHVGITFIEALTRRRMDKAKELLETTDMRTYQIAEAVGYSDPHYFGATFKKCVGETPKEYAKNRR